MATCSEGGPDEGSGIFYTVLICKWERKVAKDTWEWSIRFVKYKCTSKGCPPRSWYKYGIDTEKHFVNTRFESETIFPTIRALAADDPTGIIYRQNCLDRGHP